MFNNYKDELANKVIYQIYTRNFTREGTFNAISEKLDYLKDLGVDIIYLLPISPIGKLNRKGKLGSPYAIEDYLAINPELGTLDDLTNLIINTHAKKMKIIIDIVFNHTSRDSKISLVHPDWMYRDKNGQMANKVGDWSDVYDLDLENDELCNYLVDVIDYYSSLGIDGYRFDVVSLLSRKFLEKLQKMLLEKYPNTILLGESVEPSFNGYLRSRNISCLSDGELYQLGFDMLYMYDCYPYLRSYLENGNLNDLNVFKMALLHENSANPKDSLRIRGLENHDQKRIYEFSKKKNIMMSLAAMTPFMKGPMFIYNGLETKAKKVLNLFNKDSLDWSIDEDWFNFIRRLIVYKKDQISRELLLSLPSLKDGAYLLITNYYSNGQKAYGIFPLKNNVKIFDDDLEDGIYINYLTNKEVIISNHLLKTSLPLYLFKK